MNINPEKIGIMGFSAGGHLSAITSNSQKRSYSAKDDIDKLSCEINFSILTISSIAKLI